MTDVAFHALRHTHASMLIANNVDASLEKQACEGPLRRA
jgi:hypothetical protein